MKNLFFLSILILCISNKVISRDIGQTEITTEDGIEVFQVEKYYLLKKNVSIVSDNFELSANQVKAYFEKDLYDIIKIESEGNVKLISSKGLIATGEKIDFSTKNEDIIILGIKSSLIYNNINMFSNERIQVNNLNGKFNIKGKNSILKSKNIQIYGSLIDGKYINVNDSNEIETLYVEDENQSNIITETSNMFAKKVNYDKKENIIELFENVKIIRGGEIITGDYAEMDTLNEAYKIKSKNNQKVKALISSTNE